MKRSVLIVHGIHTNDNAAWMDILVSAFQRRGWAARKWTYGYATALLTRWQNPGRADKLAAMIEPGEVVLGHSNGGCLAWMAAERGAPMGGAILLNPALDTDKTMAAHVPWVNLYPNRFDNAVPFAEVFRSHPWGAQGRDGLTVQDARYKTVWTNQPRRDAPAVRGHSGVLEAEAIWQWADVFVNQAEARYT